jgi:hypothetical protein
MVLRFQTILLDIKEFFRVLVPDLSIPKIYLRVGIRSASPIKSPVEVLEVFALTI